MATVKEDVESFVERMRDAAGENLESIVLYGSAAREDFNEQYSDVNLLCLVKRVDGAALAQVAPVVQWWSGRLGRRPPLVITTEELRESADVFAIEMLDIKEAHRILYGADVISDVDVPMNLHRVQLEHELRTVLLKLRQQLLLAPGDEFGLETVMAKSVSSVVVLFRHALLVLGERQELTKKRGMVTRVGEVLGVDTAAVQAALDVREGRRLQRGVATTYSKYVECVAALVQRINDAVPKSEWKRVASKEN